MLIEAAESMVSTHSRLKAAGIQGLKRLGVIAVSTHSRLKAAEGAGEKEDNAECFNTQPPEGGWLEQRTKRIK